MRMNKSKLMATAGVCAALASARSANAGTWSEVGDAGNSLVTANIPAGVGTLTAVSGTLSATDGVDIYRIQITSVAAFSVSLQSGASFDTQLFLFDSLGLGITHHDEISGTVLQSRITGANVPSAGVYYLAVSSFDHDPMNIAGQEIWSDTPYTTERAPDGPGRTGRLASWGGTPGAGGAYSMAVAGAGFTLIPTPGTAVLVMLGGLTISRRKRENHGLI